MDEPKKPEVNRELQALAGMAAEVDRAAGPTLPPPGPGQGPAPVPMGPNEAEELASVIKLAVGFATPIFPSLKGVYTDATIQALTVTALPVMAKHGWSLGGVAAKWGPELAFAAVALPVALATYQGIQADIAARRRDKPVTDTAPAPAPKKPASAPESKPAAPEPEQATAGAAVNIVL